jgi:hypothetical protein
LPQRQIYAMTFLMRRKILPQSRIVRRRSGGEVAESKLYRKPDSIFFNQIIPPHWESDAINKIKKIKFQRTQIRKYEVPLLGLGGS